MGAWADCAYSPGQPEAVPGYLYGLERCHTIAPCHNSIRYIGTRPRARGSAHVYQAVGRPNR